MIDKIKFMEATSKTNQAKSKAMHYTPSYLKDNNATDSVSFTGQKGRSRKKPVNHHPFKEVGVRLGAFFLALSSALGTVSCGPAPSNKNNQSAVESSPLETTTAFDIEIATPSDAKAQTLVQKNDEIRAKYNFDSNLVQQASFDYTNVLKDGSKLIDRLELEDDTIYNFDDAFEAFDEEDNKYKNIGSATVIATKNHEFETAQTQDGTYLIPGIGGESLSLENIIKDAYKDPESGEFLLTENGIKSAAWAIIDNNEEIANIINKDYVTIQMAESLKEDLETEENLPNYAISAIKDIAEFGRLDFSNPDYSFLNEPTYDAFFDNEADAQKAAEIKGRLEFYQHIKFDEIDSRAKMDRIPTEVIFMSDLSSLEVPTIITPAIHTVREIGTEGVKFSSNVEFPAKEETMTLVGEEFEQIKQKYEGKENAQEKILSEAQTKIKNAIAKQYSTQGKQLAQDRYGNYNLSSYAGQNILKTLLLDEANNEIFNGEKITTLDDVVTILANKMLEGEDVELSTADTALSFIYKNRLNDTTGYSVAVRKINTAYLHKTKEMVSLAEVQKLAYAEGKDEATMSDLLNFIEYNGTTLKQALEDSLNTSKEQEMKAFAASAVRQLVETNPNVFRFTSAFNKMSADELLNTTLGSVQYNTLDNEAKQITKSIDNYMIQLENIVYMEEEGAPDYTPVTRKRRTPQSSTPQNTNPPTASSETEAPTVPELTVTENVPEPSKPTNITRPGGGGGGTPSRPTPAPTEPKPTEPKPTEPKPTSPQPTQPQPTSPQPTSPQPTQPQPTEPQPTSPQPTSPQPTSPQPTSPQPTSPQPTPCPTGPDVPIVVPEDEKPISSDIPNNVPDNNVDYDEEDGGDDVGQAPGGDTTNKPGNVPDSEVGIDKNEPKPVESQAPPQQGDKPKPEVSQTPPPTTEEGKDKPEDVSGDKSDGSPSDTVKDPVKDNPKEEGSKPSGDGSKEESKGESQGNGSGQEQGKEESKGESQGNGNSQEQGKDESKGESQENNAQQAGGKEDASDDRSEVSAADQIESSR